MTPLVKALIIASYMRSILDNWTLSESSKPLFLLKRRVRMFMDKRRRISNKDYMFSVEIGNIAWYEVIAKHKAQRVVIEGSITVIKLWNKHEEILTKYANISDKVMTNFCLAHYDGEAAIECENNADRIVKDLIEATDRAFIKIQEG